MTEFKFGFGGDDLDELRSKIDEIKAQLDNGISSVKSVQEVSITIPVGHGNGTAPISAIGPRFSIDDCGWTSSDLSTPTPTIYKHPTENTIVAQLATTSGVGADIEVRAIIKEYY